MLSESHLSCSAPSTANPTSCSRQRNERCCASIASAKHPLTRDCIASISTRRTDKAARNSKEPLWFVVHLSSVSGFNSFSLHPLPVANALVAPKPPLVVSVFCVWERKTRNNVRVCVFRLTNVKFLLTKIDWGNICHFFFLLDQIWSRSFSGQVPLCSFSFCFSFEVNFKLLRHVSQMVNLRSIISSWHLFVSNLIPNVMSHDFSWQIFFFYY